MFIETVNPVFFTAFAIDYVIELILTGDRGTYVRREWTSLLIVVG